MFGYCQFGKLGLGDNQNRNIPTQILNFKVKQQAAGANHTVIIYLENNIWTFGYNEYGQLGLGDNKNINKPTQILNLKAK
jgi:alpha-tubulin suppressor-like RCC1 family protein